MCISLYLDPYMDCMVRIFWYVDVVRGRGVPGEVKGGKGGQVILYELGVVINRRRGFTYHQIPE